MSRAETLTHLPLDRWATLIGLHSAHFNGVYFGNSPTVCQSPWMQRADQAVDRVGREEVAAAIAQAEADIENALGYRLLPTWETDEWRPTIPTPSPDLIRMSPVDLKGLSQIVEANWKYLISGGIRSKSLIQAGAAITFTDEDGDTYKETATVSAVVVSGQSPCELRVYYPASGSAAEPRVAADDRYEIRPVSVSISGVNATIRFRREQVVKISAYDDLFPDPQDSHLRGVDGAIDANFLASVDIYRVYNDPQTQATFLWEPFGSGCTCDTGGCELCAYTAQTGCLLIRSDPRLGLFSYRPGTWNGTTLNFDSDAWALGWQPDIVRLYYYAGWRNKSLACPTVQLDSAWERIIAYYAAALLDRPVCECNNVHAWIEHWRRDLAVPGVDEGLRASDADLNNPFGTRRGAVFAWRRVKEQGIGRSLVHA